LIAFAQPIQKSTEPPAKKANNADLDTQRGIEISVFREGMHAENKQNYPLAIQYYNEAANIAERYKFYPDIFEIYNSNLNAYYYIADYPDAMDIAQKGLSLAGRLNDKEDQAHYYNQAGFIYLKQYKADESIRYNTQYLKLAIETHNRMMIADANNSIGDDYLLKKDYKTSLSYFFKALGIYNKMNDAERFDRSRTSFKYERIAYTLFKISAAYKQAGNYTLALRYSMFDINQYSKSKGAAGFNRYDLASYYINAGNIYSLLNQYKHAGVFLDKGLKIARSILHREDMRDAYAGLSKNFAAQHRYDSAFYYHVLYTGLKDSIVNERVSREINQLEVERENKEIALLNQRQKLRETEIARQNITRNFIIGFAAFIAAVSILLIYIKGRVKQQKLVFEKQLAIQTERQRISSDMHDDIGTGLSTMLIYVNILQAKLTAKRAHADIERVATLGNELVAQMKEIVWSLNPANDSLENLLVFIRQYFAQLFEPLPYHAEIIFPASIPDIAVKGSIRRNIFLSVKEALNNVLKHANADRVELNVQLHQDKLIIGIKDNGTGFPDNPADKFFSNGLKNMQRRIDQINGKLKFFNEGGAVVSIEFRLNRYTNG
jgi:signal transduction histidine kinase